MSKRARDEDGKLSSERDRAKAKRDAKWNWVNDQGVGRIDHQRVLTSPGRRVDGLRQSHPTFDEVIKVMDLLDRTRHFVWDRMDVARGLDELRPSPPR